MEITIGNDSMPHDFSPYTGGVIEDSTELCIVCLTDECEGENKEIWHRHILKCNHQIHTRCCRKWWTHKNKPNCPYCGDIEMIKENAWCNFCKRWGHYNEDEVKCIVKPINILPNEKLRDAFVRVGKKKYFINTPYAKKDIAKNLGARWDPKKKKWYYKTEDVCDIYSKLSDQNMNKLIELFT